MIGREAIEQILAQYAKHGWILRRVLLSDALLERIGDASSLFGEAGRETSDIDAAWFSRSSRSETTAWELRRLSETPFALVTAVPEGSGPDEKEAILRETEQKIREIIAGRSPGT